MAVSNGDGLDALEKKIIRQVEYYFGDINLSRDKFLREKTREEDGWVSMDVMLNFNRLKSISEDKEAICKALQKSTSGLMEVSEDLTKIRRNPDKPLPDNTQERKDDMAARSVYAKGFPKDSTLDTLMEFFEEHGKIDTILMRRDRPDRTFKGSVFVTFSDKSDGDTFLATAGIKYQDTELIKMSKEDYFKMKTEEEREKKKNKPGNKKEEKKKEEDKRMEDQITKGAVAYMKGLPKDTTLEDIKTFFGDFGDVAWVEFATGDEKALVRFREGEAESALKKIKDQNDGKVIMKDSELETKVLEGEEEKEYWRKMFKDIADRKQKSRSKGFQNRKRKFGNRSNQKGNKQDDDGAPAAKAKKTDG